MKFKTLLIAGVSLAAGSLQAATLNVYYDMTTAASGTNRPQNVVNPGSYETSGSWGGTTTDNSPSTDGYASFAGGSGSILWGGNWTNAATKTEGSTASDGFALGFMMRFDGFNDGSQNNGSIFTSSKNNANSLKLGLKNVSQSEGTAQIDFSQTNQSGSGTGNDAPTISLNSWYYVGLSQWNGGNYQLFLCDLATGTTTTIDLGSSAAANWGNVQFFQHPGSTNQAGALDEVKLWALSGDDTASTPHDLFATEANKAMSILVPEPATATLGLLGLASLLMRRRRS
ncbi:hypothetical protein [uncultured Akkermansia sp.]|uniref:hypothetical protein n=1 Tax=uncultured Akkermansia sp. TaxID=512294 RepID=UPI00265D522A|nr:hypothetical protein [uncultured Akkermansia sp.]